MSWTILNEILGLALVDPTFQKELLENPVEAVEKRNFHITEEEREALRSSKSNTLREFTRKLVDLLP